MPNSVVYVNYRYLGSIECCCEGSHMQPYFQKEALYIYYYIIYIARGNFFLFEVGGGCGMQTDYSFRATCS